MKDILLSTLVIIVAIAIIVAFILSAELNSPALAFTGVLLLVGLVLIPAEQSTNN